VPPPPSPPEAKAPTEAARVAPREPERPRPSEPERPAPAEPDRRELLRGVPAPPAERPPPLQAPSPVVPFRPRPQTAPREWNLWDLERLARDETRRDPARRDEWVFLILHLRRFANADGLLPADFDPLVRESFAGLLERSQQT
jgi:hypothetical protein